MATRHDVANLERRGHTFYRRARVPIRFRQARLSFSLRLSAHGKAAYTARRLNTLLADLTVRPTAAMTTKDQLDQIFRAEIGRMTAHLEDIAFADRRTGLTDDVRELNVADRWPLIDRRQNAPVASTLPEEERPRFEPDATDAEIGGESIERRDATTSVSVIALTASASTSEPDLAFEQPHGAGDEAAGSPAAGSPLPAPTVSPETSAEIISALAAPVTSVTSEAVGGTNLPISDFDTAYESLARNKRDDWEPSTATDVRADVTPGLSSSGNQRPTGVVAHERR